MKRVRLLKTMKRITCQLPPMRQIKRLASSSLVITVVISLILSILCSSVILLAYYNRQSQKTTDIENRVSDNLESAINLVLADTTIYLNPLTVGLDLFREEKDSVVISKKTWGLFQVAHVKAFYSKFSKSKSFFYGTTMPEYMNGCLYMADHQRPLSLVGEAKLVGDAYIPKAGLKASYIDQRGYSYKQLINGSVKISNENLPELNESIIENLKSLLRTGKSITAKSNPLNKDSISWSFSDTALFFFGKGKVSLKNCILRGQVIILSDNEIEVENTAKFEDVILVAPTIIFKENFQGTVQAIASDSLIVGNGCLMEYPSSLVLIKNENETF